MLKSAFDIAVASTGLIITAPISLPLIFAAAAEHKSHPIFKQQRMGYKNTPFTIYKIKTMSDATNKDGKPLPDDQRVSAFGKIIRKSRLDELPQLFNVLKGDMSIVGPRPHMLIYESARDQKRHTVRPGMTGPTQILGSNALSSEEILKLDHEYVDNNSVLSDFWIFAQTPWSIIKNWSKPHNDTRAQNYLTPREFK